MQSGMKCQPGTVYVFHRWPPQTPTADIPTGKCTLCMESCRTAEAKPLPSLLVDHFGTWKQRYPIQELPA